MNVDISKLYDDFCQAPVGNISQPPYQILDVEEINGDIDDIDTRLANVQADLKIAQDNGGVIPGTEGTVTERVLQWQLDRNQAYAKAIEPMRALVDDKESGFILAKRSQKMVEADEERPEWLDATPIAYFRDGTEVDIVYGFYNGAAMIVEKIKRDFPYDIQY